MLVQLREITQQAVHPQRKKPQELVACDKLKLRQFTVI